MNWLLGIKGYLAVALIAGLVACTLVYVAGAEKAKSRLIVLEIMLGNAENAARHNSTAFDECKKANTVNADEAHAQRLRAIGAERQVAALTALADSDVLEVDNDATIHRATGLECPAITADFRIWLRSDS